MFRFLKIAVTALVLAYCLLVGTLYMRQDKMIFDAGGDYKTPAEIGLAGISEAPLKTSDGQTLMTWYAPAKPSMPTLLFFHGKGGNISGRPKRYAYYIKHGLGVLAVEYRGYGASTGAPSEAGFMIDAATAHQWLKAQGVPETSIVFVGESLGTGVATIAAARHGGAALLLEAPYTSVADVAADRYWYVPVRLLLRHHFDAMAVIKTVKMPILILHGTVDETVPFKYGQALFEAAPGPKEFVAFEGEGHKIFNKKTWAKEIDFLRRHLKVAHQTAN